MDLSMGESIPEIMNLKVCTHRTLQILIVLQVPMTKIKIKRCPSKRKKEWVSKTIKW